MADHDHLIDALSGSAGPVKRPLPTTVRALAWIGLALPCGVLATLFLHHGWTDWAQPGAIWPMLSLSLSLILGTLGIVTAFDLGIAGRKVAGPRVFVPLILAWLAASLMSIAESSEPIGRFGSGTYCYSFMILASLPMIPMAILALRRTRALRPGKTLAVAGLGIAFMACGLLMLCHSIDEQVIDFLMHLAAAGTIVAMTVAFGRHWVRVG